MSEARRTIPSSFRDPSGVVFEEQGTIYREVRRVYRESYDLLLASGLYDKLVAAGLLLPHEEVSTNPGGRAEVYKILRPQRVPLISYPYEWSFGQIKDAALATLEIHRLALEHGMALKDASAYNIQFVDSRPILIDTLSFEPWREGSPWVAYRQFCQHFLAPLALMAYRDVRLGHVLRAYLDGVPLDLAARLLPRRTLLRLSLLLHIHLHARAQRRYAAPEKRRPVDGRRITKLSQLGLVDSLAGGVRGLKWRPAGTEWADYYSGDSYQDEAFAAKASILASFIEQVRPSTVWDLGANTGHFSKIAADSGAFTVAFDLDTAAIERLYLACRDHDDPGFRLDGRASARRGDGSSSQRRPGILPLVLDLTNPSPSIGWAHSERMSLLERGPADMVLALALVHHLAISNNVPLDRVAEFFSRLAPWLAIEFVPKEDLKVQQLLAGREDIFPGYTQAGFEAAFGAYYAIEAIRPIPQSVRTLYLMRRKE